MKTREQLDRESYLRIYFHYWKLQNNPEYIQFYKSAKEKGYIESVSTMLKFQLGILGMGKPVEPSKKIDWNGFIHSRIVDPEIIEALKHSSALTPVHEIRLIDAGENWEPRSEIAFHINFDRFDKKEILHEMSKLIDWHRNNLNIKILNRDQIQKYYLYAQVWDLRKGFPKPTFSEIGRKLRRPLQTVISQFKRAHELLYNKPYESNDYKALRRSFVRKTTCKDCPEKPSCKIPCPDVQILLEEFEISQPHKLYKRGKEKFTYELAADREGYRKWREESN